MKRLLILLIFSIVFESCIEKLDSAEPKFEKLYGYNANSIASGIAECSDGSYLIYGSADKTRLDMENSNGGTTEDQMPILIKIDQHGNEIISRTYPIKQLLYEIEFDGINRFNIYEAWFTTAIQMNNGRKSVV